MILGCSALAIAGILTTNHSDLVLSLRVTCGKFHVSRHTSLITTRLTLSREWAVVATALQLRGETVMRMILQDFRRIGVDVRGNGDVAACERHVHAAAHTAQTEGVVFVMQEGNEVFAGFKSNSKSESAAATAATTGAYLFEGSWSHVFDSVMSCFSLLP